MIYCATNCRSSLRGMRALGGESLVGHFIFTVQACNFNPTLERDLSKCLSNDIAIALVLCRQLECKTCMIYRATNCHSSLQGVRALGEESLVRHFKFTGLA